jgi:hypothetical protein
MRPSQSLLVVVGFWIALNAEARVALADPATEQAQSKRETWQAIAIRGQRVGYGHQVVSRHEQDGTTIVRTDLHMHSAVKRFDGKLTLIVDQSTEEELDGTLRSFRFQLDNPPASRMELVGRVEGGKLRVTTTAGGQSAERTLDLPVGIKSPSYAERLIEESPPRPGEPVELRMFEPQLNNFVTIRVSHLGAARFTLPGGKPQEGSHLLIEYLDGIPGLTADVYLDAAGRGVLNESRLLGTTTWLVAREEALRDAPADVDLGLAAILPVKGLRGVHRAGEAVYRISSDEGLAVDRYPAGDTQSATSVDDRTVELTVRSIDPRSAPPMPASEAAPPAEAYLAATTFATTGDAEIVKLANNVAPAEATPAEIAVGCEQAVHKWLTRKNLSSNLATASEVVRSREGDCTEHAVLLTALLRARGVPARVVVGLVYGEELQAFIGHAWTEAWLGGRWVPLDATLALGGIGCGHIKLGDSSLDDGDAALIAGSVAVWQMLHGAKVEVVRVTPRAAPAAP